MGKKIFLIESNHYVLQAMSLLLEHDKRFDIVGKADQFSEEIFLKLTDLPDVILWDMDLMDPSTPDNLQRFRSTCPGAVVVATSLRPEHDSKAREIGMDGFLVKHLLPKQFLTKLESILEQHRA